MAEFRGDTEVKEILNAIGQKHASIYLDLLAQVIEGSAGLGLPIRTHYRPTGLKWGFVMSSFEQIIFSLISKKGEVSYHLTMTPSKADQLIAMGFGPTVEKMVGAVSLKIPGDQMLENQENMSSLADALVGYVRGYRGSRDDLVKSSTKPAPYLKDMAQSKSIRFQVFADAGLFNKLPESE